MTHKKSHADAIGAPKDLGGLIAAIASKSQSDNEVTATIADLLGSGRVRLVENGQEVRARVVNNPLGR